jgi:lipopolysaccharide transport system ATP-binding protein
VKHYSSGMYLRLAFAVAAHLEPEILLVDEVLAVGDAAFQKKCLGKMGEVAKEGRTVLFVSHNMSQIRRLCQKGVLIKQGRCKEYGSMDSIIASYQLDLATASRHNTNDSSEGEAKSGFLGWEILNAASKHVVDSSGSLQIEVYLDLSRPIASGHHGLVLQSTDGTNICGWGISGLRLEPGRYTISYQIPFLPIRPGNYSWYASLWDGADRIDVTHLLPELLVTTQSNSTLSDEWSGILNLPCHVGFRDFSNKVVGNSEMASGS